MPDAGRWRGYPADDAKSFEVTDAVVTLTGVTDTTVQPGFDGSPWPTRCANVASSASHSFCVPWYPIVVCWPVGPEME